MAVDRGHRFPQGSRSASFEDMLLLLAPKKSGDGGAAEVEATPPNTRGTGESTAAVGQRQAPPVDPRQVEIADARAACATGRPNADQLVLIRGLLRVPWTLTYGRPCEDPSRHLCCSTPRHYHGAQIADSLCELDGTCWVAEREAHNEFRSLHARSAGREDANYRRGVPVAGGLPIEQLAAVNAPEAPASIAGLREQEVAA